MDYLKGNVCVFGDSISWGASDLESAGWVTQLLLYAQKNIEDETIIYNLGIPSENTSGLIKRLENESNARNPETIIIASGINDCHYKKSLGRRSIEIEEFEKNIYEIIRMSKKYTFKIVFVGLTSVNEKLTTPTIWSDDEFFRNEDIKEYNYQLKEICSKEKIVFIDVIDLLTNEDLDSADGIHPNSQGHKKLFDYIMSQLY